MFFNTFRGERRRKEGTNLRIGWAFFLFFFFFKPKTCYSNRGQMLIDDLLRTKNEEESLRRRTQKFIVLVWFLVKSPGEETICPPPQNMVVVMLVYIFIEQQLLLEDLKRKHWPTIQSDSIFSQRTQDKQDRFSSRHCFLPNSKTQIQNWPIFPKVQILIKL